MVQQQEERRRGALVERRGRLRRALEGPGEEEEKVEAPLLKETECPVCLQVGNQVKEDSSMPRRWRGGSGNARLVTCSVRPVGTGLR